MSKKLKTLNFKVEEELLAKLNYYRGHKNETQLEFLKEAINEKCNNEKLLRCGGMILKVPNPNFYNLSEEQRIKIIQTLSNCVNELNNITPYADMGLSEILSYAQIRFLKDDKAKKSDMKRNRDEDMKFEEER